MSTRPQPSALPDDAAARARLLDTVAGVLAGSVAPGASVCVALSGGVDSTALLHALAQIRPHFGFELAAAHVHHGLSLNADAWADSCARQCALLGVAFHRLDVAVPRGDPSGLEAAARVVRHAALTRPRCDWLAFGHHQDDQAETLLFRLLRGAGVRGAGAMSAVEPGAPGRLRPLLGLRRADIVAFARASGLEWVDDESNRDPRHARNFLRHHVLPVVESAFPGAVPALVRASGQFREADALLGELAELDAAACGGPQLRRNLLLGLSDERLRNLLRWRIRAAGSEAPSRARLVEAVRQLRAAPATALRLPLGQVACCVYRNDVWIEPAHAVADLPAAPLVWHGEAALPWGGGAVRFEAAAGEGIASRRLRAARRVELVPRWPGAVLREAPDRPRRSFKNLCQEAGIPAWLRGQLPVLRVDGEAAWIGAIGIAAEFRCGEGEPGVLPVWQR